MDTFGTLTHSGSICGTDRAPCQSIGNLVLPNQPSPREAENFPGVGKYPKNVPLPVLLAYLQPAQSIILD